MEQHYDEEIEIDVRELFYVLLDQWVKIVISAVLCAAIALGYCKMTTVPLYSSTAKLYVLTKSTSITSLADIQSGTNLTQDYKVVINSRPVVEQVINNLELDYTYETLSGRLSIENPQNTRILNITVADTDPERAKLIVDELASVASNYIADKMDQDAPNIIENGYVNDVQINSNTAKNTLIGAVLGVFLACIVLIAAHLMNDTIMTSDDLEKYLGLNTLASIPLNESEGKVSRKSKNAVKKEIRREINKYVRRQQMKSTKKKNRK